MASNFGAITTILADVSSGLPIVRVMRERFSREETLMRITKRYTAFFAAATIG